MTVGVSSVSQEFLYYLMNQMAGYPTKTESFENQAWQSLIEAKQLLCQVHPEVLEVSADLPQQAGMFAFVKKGGQYDENKSKIHAIDGELFGVPGYVRINVAFNLDTMHKMVERWNASRM
jgi:hypothetical protein